MTDLASIAGLTLYPIKSCAGIALHEATVSAAGLSVGSIGDREWMVVNQRGEFVTQRQIPRMALIVPSIHGDALTLSAPGQAILHIPPRDFALSAATTSVTVWGHTCNAFDEGDAVAAWFSALLNQRVRLVRFDPAHQRVANRERTVGKDGGIRALSRFSDGYPLLAISQGSLNDLNERLQEAGREALPMNRFRPNIVLTGVAPYEEDHLARFSTASVDFVPVKPCPRCPIPSIDQATGERGPSPLDILQRYRERDEGIVFGQYVIVARGVGQRVSVGDALTLEMNF